MIPMKSKKKKGTRRSAYKPKKRLQGRWDYFVHFCRRFGLVMGAVVLTLWAGGWLYLSGSFTKAGEWSRQQTIEISAAGGFRVANILVEGRVHTDPHVLMGLMNIQKDDPLFAFNPAEARALIEQISWVETARVERRWPDTIFVDLKERQPLAIYERANGPVLIDREGEALTDYQLERFDDLLIVSGTGANTKAQELVDLLASEPVIERRIAGAEWIGGRRWNLITHSGASIRLPADDIGLALRSLAMAQEDKALLDSDPVYIDLRSHDRIILKNKSGEDVREYKAQYQTGNAL